MLILVNKQLSHNPLANLQTFFWVWDQSENTLEIKTPFKIINKRASFFFYFQVCNLSAPHSAEKLTHFNHSK